MLGAIIAWQDDTSVGGVDPSDAGALLRHAQRVVPVLRGVQLAGSYAGLRPATEFRDYQINLDSALPWVTVAGIRSTGVTAAIGCVSLVLPVSVDVSAAWRARGDIDGQRNLCQRGNTLTRISTHAHALALALHCGV